MNEVLNIHKPFRDAVLIAIFTITFAPPMVAIIVVMIDYTIEYFMPSTVKLFKLDLLNYLTIAIWASYVLGSIPALLASFVAAVCAWKFKVLKLRNVLIISGLTTVVFATLISILDDGSSDLSFKVFFVLLGAGLLTGYNLHKIFYRWLSVSKLSLTVDLDNKGTE